MLSMSVFRLFTLRCGHRAMPSSLHCFFSIVTTTLSSHTAILIGMQKCRDANLNFRTFFPGPILGCPTAPFCTLLVPSRSRRPCSCGALPPPPPDPKNSRSRPQRGSQARMHLHEKVTKNKI
jgi:hypothetical protein